MKKLILFLSFIAGLAINLQAQELAPYDRTRQSQVLTDRAAQARFFIAIPGNLTMPAYIPDSLKGKGIWMVSSGPTRGMYRFDITTNSFVFMGKSAADYADTAGYVQKLIGVVHLSTIAQMQAYTGTASTVMVTDTLQGGGTPFNYVATGTADNVITYTRTSGGYWVRQYNKGSPVDLRWGGVTNTKTVAQNKAIINAYTTAHPDAYIALRSAYIPLDSITISNNIRIYDQSTKNEIFSGQKTGKSVGAGGLHYIIQGAQAGLPGRLYILPGSNMGAGANTGKLDIFFDNYEKDIVNYRITNFDGFNDYDHGTAGVAFWGAKGVGNYFGIGPQIHIGFNDNSATSVPLLLQKYDYTDSVWHKPFKGAWFTALAMTTGDYVTASNHLYRATTTGTTGATVPSHTSGTVSDGSVSWLFIKDYSGAESAKIQSSVIIGDESSEGLTQIPLGVRLQIHRDVIIKNTASIYWAGNTNQVLWTQSVPLNGTDYRMTSSNGTNAFQRWESSKNYIQNSGLAWMIANRFITNNSTTPNVDSAMMITFINTVPTPITNLVGEPYQLLYLQTGNTNTSLVYGTNIQTTAQENLVLLPNTTYIFQNNSSGVWQQVTPGLASATAAGIIGGSADQTFEPGKKIFQGNIDATASVTGSTTIMANNSNGGTAADARIGASNGTSNVQLIKRGTGFTSNADKGYISQTGSSDFGLILNGNVRFTWTAAGNYGIRNSAPSAALHLPAGVVTASGSPLKFTTGVTGQTTIEQGAVNWDGTNLHIGSTGSLTDQTFAYLNSPAFITPNLGIPSAGVLTNVTGLTTAGLVNNAVTYAKMQVMTTNKLLGSGSGTAVAEITLGTGLSFTGTTLNVTGLVNPMTTLGDVIYGGVSGAATRLGGNTTTTRKFLTQTGDGTNSAAPAFFDLLGANNTWTGSQTFATFIFGTSFNNNAATVVSGSTSGTATFKMPEQGTAIKKVIIYCAALNGTATYTFPTAFTFVPQVTTGAAISKSITTTDISVFGATDTGYIILEGY